MMIARVMVHRCHADDMIAREPKPSVIDLGADTVPSEFVVDHDLVVRRDIIFSGSDQPGMRDRSGGLRGRFARINRRDAESMDVAAGDAPDTQRGGRVTAEESFGINAASRNAHIESRRSAGVNLAADSAKITCLDSTGYNIGSFSSTVQSFTSTGWNAAMGQDAETIATRFDGYNFAANSGFTRGTDSTSFNFATFDAVADSTLSTGYNFAAGTNSRAAANGTMGSTSRPDLLVQSARSPQA